MSVATALDLPVAEAMSPALVVGADESIDAVVARLTAEGRSAAVIMADGRAEAIVTDADIRARYVACRHTIDPSAAIGTIASRPLRAVGPQAAIADAVQTMTASDIKHLPVIDADGQPVGILTSSGLLTALAGDPVGALVEARQAADAAELAQIYRGLPARVGRLVGTGVGGLAVVRLLSMFSEAAVRRATGWACDELGPPPARYAMVALGSLARREQTLVTDQDHALVIEDGAGEHPWFADFGQLVTDILTEIGFPRCPGNIMIANPEWRHEQRAWRARWSQFLRAPDPEHVLATNIVLDARTIDGDDDLTEPFFSIAGRAATEGSLLPFLANSAREFRPPTGLFGRWKLERVDGRPPAFDIKKGAIAPIVHIARVHGLAAGSRSMETVGRLADAAEAGLLSADSADILVNGYELATTIRLIEQAGQAERGGPLDNWIAPSGLTAWQRAGLREVFKTVRLAQDAIGQAYQGANIR